MAENIDNEQEWPIFLDAMIAAPDHHEILLENDRVRVLDSRVKAGDTTPIHTHRWPSLLYILESSDFVRSDPEGNVIFDSRESETVIGQGQIVWSQPLRPHFVRNIGDGEIRVISVELKD